MNQTIDYAPRRRGGITNRLLVVLLCLSVLCVLMAVRLAYATTVDHVTFEWMWGFFAVCITGLAGFIALIRWIVLGSGR